MKKAAEEKTIQPIEVNEKTNKNCDLSDISKEQSIRNENKKALKKFVPIVIASTIVGAVSGASVMLLDVSSIVTKIQGTAGEILQLIGYWGVIITALIGYTYPRVVYKKSKAEYEKCVSDAQAVSVAGKEEEPDEEIIFNIEKKMNNAMEVLGASNILQMMFYGIGMCNISQGVEKHWILLIVVTIVFVAGIYITIKNQQLMVDLAKIMNPELEGSVYDMKFHEKWEESCDEMAKLFIYQSAYKAYQAGNKACVVLWVISAFMGMAFGTGPLPIIFVSIIWLVLSMVYCREAKKLDKH